jgi:integrase/recombinase XerC
VSTQLFKEGAAAFRDHLDITRNLSTNTLKAYTKDVQDFLVWLPKYQEVGFDKLATQYLIELNKQALSKTSISRKGSALRTFFGFLIKEQYFRYSDLPLKFHLPKAPRHLPCFLSSDEVDKLIEATRGEGVLNKRDVAIIDVMFSSGVRVGELVGLNFDQIDFEKNEMRVMGKGGQERIAFMSRRAMSHLLEYLTKPDGYLIERSGSEPVFMNYVGGRLDVRSIRRMLLNSAKKANINKPVHPHALRHSFATHLINHDVDIRVVQELLGHAKISSTQIYTHVAVDKLREAYLKAHPRALMIV